MAQARQQLQLTIVQWHRVRCARNDFGLREQGANERMESPGVLTQMVPQKSRGKFYAKKLVLLASIASRGERGVAMAIKSTGSLRELRPFARANNGAAAKDIEANLDGALLETGGPIEGSIRQLEILPLEGHACVAQIAVEVLAVGVGALPVFIGRIGFDLGLV